MYNIIYETSCQSRFDERYWMLEAGALGRLRGMVQGGRREEGSGWGTCVYLWWIHVDIWQNQYNIVKLKNKIKRKKITELLNKTKQKKPSHNLLKVMEIQELPDEEFKIILQKMIRVLQDNSNI